MARSLIVLFNHTIDGGQACFLTFDRISNVIGLSPSTNGGWTVASFGSPGHMENKSCRVNTQTATVTQNGPNWEFRIEVEFSPWLRGSHTIYGLAVDTNNQTPAGWIVMGTHTPFALPPMPVLSVQPSNSSGPAPLITYRVEAQADGRFIRDGWALISPVIDSGQGCTVSFDTYSKLLRVDPQTAGPSGTAGQALVLTGARCSVDLSRSDIVPDATGLTVELQITFPSTFTGTKNNYVIASDRSGRSTGWQTVGTWTPAATAPSALSYAATPVSGPSRSVFTFTFGGGGNFGGGLILFNRALDGNQACFLVAGRNPEYVYLAQDNGSWPGIALGQNGTLENSFWARLGNLWVDSGSCEGSIEVAAEFAAGGLKGSLLFF